MLPPLPRCSGWACSSLVYPSHISLPRKGYRVGLHIVLFEACSAFTRVAACIVLTKNEVGHASKPKSDCILFVLHTIRLVKGKAEGGKRLLLEPWRPDAARLTPITYTGAVSLTLTCL